MSVEVEKDVFIDVEVWNATVANLTLMALGSSAPEILLSVIGTVSDIEATPSKLGPSTIVGSAAFNLLVISGLSIYAVGTKENPETKKVFDTGVFAVTGIGSIFAYVWLYLTLQSISYEIIEPWEAWATFIFFFALVAMSFTADKINQFFQGKLKSEKKIEEEKEERRRKSVKHKLRTMVKKYNEMDILQIGQGISCDAID
jgi:Ca2+/Na+ antiporter